MPTAKIANPFSVGDGATLCGYSDRTAYTVIAVTASTITLQRDKATLLNGRDSGQPDALTFTAGGFVGHTEGVQRYSYERNTSGHIVKAHIGRKLKKQSLPCGEWTKDGQGNLVTHKLVPSIKAGSSNVIAGRHEHYDFNF